MLPSFIHNAFVNGEKATLIPIQQLQRVRQEIERFAQQAALNGFQQWIVKDLYNFDVPHGGFSAKSIILLAIPHPFYAHVEFSCQGKQYTFLSLVMSDFERTEHTLQTVVRAKNYQIVAARNIPLKRLAVHTGFAVYGRNNICYIAGLGSNFSFMAYFSDLPCDDEYWADVLTASRCAQCTACVQHCPTGAIQKDRFLIDNEKCLSYLNERGEPFPAWLPKTVHHCVFDCLMCQMTCPMNTAQLNKVVGPIQFTESETNHLLSGTPFEEYADSFKQKAKYLGFHQWPEGIAKNMTVLMELSDQMPVNKSRYAPHPLSPPLREARGRPDIGNPSSPLAFGEGAGGEVTA